jgi:hypothetical protein
MKTYSSRERKRKDRGRRKKVRERERGTEERERERRRLDPVCRAAGKHKIYNLSFRCDMRFANLLYIVVVHTPKVVQLVDQNTLDYLNKHT